MSISYNKPYPNGWIDGSAGGTPINADALDKIDIGINACVTEINKLENSKQDKIMFDGEYNAGTNKAATVTTVTSAIGSAIGNLLPKEISGAQEKTLASLSINETGEIEATFGEISITKEQVSDYVDVEANPSPVSSPTQLESLKIGGVDYSLPYLTTGGGTLTGDLNLDRNLTTNPSTKINLGVLKIDNVEVNAKYGTTLPTTGNHEGDLFFLIS